MRNLLLVAVIGLSSLVGCIDRVEVPVVDGKVSKDWRYFEDYQNYIPVVAGRLWLDFQKKTFQILLDSKVKWTAL